MFMKQHLGGFLSVADFTADEDIRQKMIDEFEHTANENKGVALTPERLRQAGLEKGVLAAWFTHEANAESFKDQLELENRKHEQEGRPAPFSNIRIEGTELGGERMDYAF